jgi:hypothetical protein
MYKKVQATTKAVSGGAIKEASEKPATSTV